MLTSISIKKKSQSVNFSQSYECANAIEHVKCEGKDEHKDDKPEVKDGGKLEPQDKTSTSVFSTATD